MVNKPTSRATNPNVIVRSSKQRTQAELDVNDVSPFECGSAAGDDWVFLSSFKIPLLPVVASNASTCVDSRTDFFVCGY